MTELAEGAGAEASPPGRSSANKSRSEAGRPSLHLVTDHVHDWKLCETEYDDGLQVRRLECACGEVTFRAS